MFPSSRGTPLISSLFLTNHFGPARDAAGLSCRFHDLRHTSVALAIAGGAHPKAIQTRMGHSSITVTLDRYGHLFPELDEAIARSFGDELTAARSRHEHRVVNADFGQRADRPAVRHCSRAATRMFLRERLRCVESGGTAAKDPAIGAARALGAVTLR